MTKPAEAGSVEQGAGSPSTGSGSCDKEPEESVAAVYDRRPEEDGAHRAPLQLTADAPAGPASAEEAAFLAQEREMGIVTPALMHVENPEEAPGDLPPMEDLVKRIPAPARELMEELFRARFVTVKRLPKSAMKE